MYTGIDYSELYIKHLAKSLMSRMSLDGRRDRGYPSEVVSRLHVEFRWHPLR